MRRCGGAIGDVRADDGVRVRVQSASAHVLVPYLRVGEVPSMQLANDDWGRKVRGIRAPNGCCRKGKKTYGHHRKLGGQVAHLRLRLVE